MDAAVANETDECLADTSEARPEDDGALTLALESLAAGRLEALEAIWDACSRDLYGLALWRTGVREDAEDAVQEVFVRLTRCAARAAAARCPRAYLLTMVHRAAIDLGRRRKHAPIEATELLAAASAAPDAQIDARRASDLVSCLAPKLREAVFLRHFADMSFSEAAKIMGVPTFTAASRYRLALRRLRRWMGVES